MHEIDPPYGPTLYARDAAFSRVRLGDAVDGWHYRHVAPGRRRGGVSARLELGAQLEGGWRQRGARRGDGHYLRGEVHVLSPGEAYDLAFSGGGRVLGLSIDVDRLLGWQDPDRELVIPPRSRREMSELFALSAALLEDGRSFDVESALRAWLERRCDATGPDPLVRARRDLEEHYTRELYLRDVAELVGMRPETLLRRFTRRYGITPVQYRIRLRLNAAARRLWFEPERPLHAIAADEGFTSVSYFHRAFRRYFGGSPAVLRASFRTP